METQNINREEENFPAENTPVANANTSSDNEAILNIEEEEEQHEEYDFSSSSKEALIAKFKELLLSTDYLAIKGQVASLRDEFKKRVQLEHEEKIDTLIEADGDTVEEKVVDVLQDEFEELSKQYRHLRTVFLKEQEQQKLQNLEAKKKILEEIRLLIESDESLKKNYDELKELQQNWKDIGPVPRNENDNLWKTYHFLIDKFLDKVKITKELKDLDLKKNLDVKMELCEKVEALLLEPSILKSFKALQQLHEQWKEVGPVSSDKSEEVWQRFHMATEKIHERRKEYYLKQKEEREANLLAKQAICEKIEELNTQTFNTMNEWKKATDEMTALQQTWRSIGFATEEENDEVWKRFRSGLNQFFATKKEYFGKIKEELTNNYNLKLDLCKQAEALQNSTDWAYTTKELIRLQKEWKKIGPVAHKQSEAIWQRFRTACDTFFNNKEEYQKNIHIIEANNLKQKEELIEKIKQFKPDTDADAKANLAVLKEFQCQWMEMGHVPMEQKDRIFKSYKEALDVCYNNLNLNKKEAEIMTFRSRLETLQSGTDSERQLNNERQNIRKLIQKLTGEIALWENNIGFLANSKNADILKADFQKKIDKAKEELKLLEQKLRIINTTSK